MFLHDWPEGQSCRNIRGRRPPGVLRSAISTRNAMQGRPSQPAPAQLVALVGQDGQIKAMEANGPVDVYDLRHAYVVAPKRLRQVHRAITPFDIAIANDATDPMISRIVPVLYC